MKRLILIFSLLFSSVFAQTKIDSLKQAEYYTKHLSLRDTFFGNEDMYQVCYPKDHRTYFYFIIFFCIATLVFGILIIYIKTNSNKKLKEKNTIIEEQNKDLIDSINYAQRIQQAILPDQRLETEVLRNGFAFYKPKHIVSGDFYWLHKSNDLIFIALMDCTGHGVPGALLTMLAYNSINKAVVEKGLTDPTLILDSMNSDIKIALKQDRSVSIQDSMEVGLVCFNKNTGNLLFAGANTSLQHVSNNKLSIIGGGKCSVGSVQENIIELPRTHEVTINKGDFIYLYSDGFADQFGGVKGKKFKYKQLEELLMSNSSQPAEEQKRVLEQTFNNWKGNLEQVDDVCVIGLSF